MTRTNVELRPVSKADLSVVGDIYNHYVAHSVCTFDTEPADAAYWRAWLSEHTGPHPAIVAVRAGRIVGWGSLSKWNTRCAYRHSVEDSVYVRQAYHRQGIGRAILTELVALARQCGHRSIIAQIADHQESSEKLHERLGFQRVGCLKAVGFKFNRWIDVAIWQLTFSFEDDG